jgi:hypothetical protein
MVQCSTASSTNHCICDKTQRSWLSLLCKDSIIYSNKIKHLVIPVQFTALNYWPSVSDYTFLNVAVRFTVWCLFTVCRTNQGYLFSFVLFTMTLMTGVLRCVQGCIRIIFKWFKANFNVCLMYQNMSFELCTSYQHIRYENIIASETSQVY